MPLSDSQCYDLAADVGNGQIVRIQAKTTNRIPRNRNLYKVELRTSGRSIDPNKIDYLFVLAGNGDQYCIPSYDINGLTGITLGKNVIKYMIACGGSFINNDPINPWYKFLK